MSKLATDRSSVAPVGNVSPRTTVEGTCFFEADGLTFGVRIADGAALVTGGGGATARRAIQGQLSELPVRRCDLMQSAHAPAFNRSRLTLMIAQHCNLRCIYCYGGDGEYGSPGIADREGSMRLIERFLEREGPRQRSINFFGGEPLLCFDLLRELTAYAMRQAVRHDRDPVFTMTTNATLVTPAISAWLARNHFSVMVSIDGDSQMHGRNRPDAQGRNSWDAVIGGAKLLLRDLGPHAVTARATLTENFPDIDGMLRGLETIGFQSVALCAVEPVGHNTVPALTKGDFQRLRTAVQTLVVPNRLRTGKGTSWDPLKSTIKLLQTGKRRERACGVGNLSSAVSSDGNLYPCHRYVGDRRFIIGNSADGLVDDTLPGFAAFEEARRSALDECDECIAKAFCAGSCAHIAVERMDKGLAPHEGEICEFIRMGVQEALRVVAALRVPPRQGTAAVIGPEYMKRPFPLESFRTIFEDRRDQTLKRTAWGEHELSILRAKHDAVIYRMGDGVPTLRKPADVLTDEWLTYGLIKFLAATEVFGPLNEAEMGIVGSGAALAGLAGADKRVLGDAILAGQGIVEKELLAILTELMETPEDDETSRLLLALPSLGVARRRNDHVLEAAIKSFVAMVSPLRRWVKDYGRLLDGAENLNINPWHTIIQETFGELPEKEVPSMARHPKVIDMAVAQITLEMRRLNPQSPWQRQAVEAYTAWLIDRLRKLTLDSSRQ